MKESEVQNSFRDRHEAQITWYSDGASKNKNVYTPFLNGGANILSASLPVLIASVTESWQWAIVIPSTVLTIGTAGVKTFKFQENCITYGTIAETPKKKDYCYNAELDEYSEASDKEAPFVSRVESLISRENTLFVTIHMQKDEGNKKLRMANLVVHKDWQFSKGYPSH